MHLTAADFPAGTENRLSMRDGSYFLYALATAVVLARLYVRCFMNAKLVGLDDLFIILAWMTETVVIVFVKRQFDNGIGWHVKDIIVLPVDGASDIALRMVLWPWITQVLYFFEIGCIKSSICALYLRIAVTSLQKKVIWIAMGIILAEAIASTIATAAFICVPVTIVWTGKQGGFGGPKCFNLLAFNYFNAAFFVLTDICLIIGPVWVLKGLQMDTKRKFSLGIMFSLGSFAIAGTIARQVTNAIAITHFEDLTWNWAPACLCSVLETSLGLIFVSVPALYPLLSKTVSFFHSTTNSDSKSKPSRGYKLSDLPITFGNSEFGKKKGSKLADSEDMLFTMQGTESPGNRSLDDGSDRGIITRPRGEEGRVVIEGGKGGRSWVGGGKGGVNVNTEYRVDFEDSGGKS